MKMKRIISTTLITALILSLFCNLTPSVFAEPTDSAFEAENYCIDFSKYKFEVLTLEGYDEYKKSDPDGTPTHATMYDVDIYHGTEVGNWSLVEDDKAAGGKYLNYVKKDNGKNGGLYNYHFVANPKGDFKSGGDFTVLAPNTTYNMTIRYNISDLSDGYNLNLYTFASSGVATPNNVANWQDRANVKLGLGNTDGWVVATYSFKTPESYTGSDPHSLMVGFEPRVDGKTSRPAEGTEFTYNLSVDYIEIEKPEFAPQHMQIDFSSYNVSKVVNNVGSIAPDSDALWVIADEGENKYMQYPYISGSITNTGSTPYAFMANPTGSGAYSEMSEKAFILENGGEYRVSFKYRLTQLASGGTITFKVGATGPNSSCCNGWSGANTAIALTPQEGTTGITLASTDDWKTVSYTFVMSSTVENARRSMQVAFVPNAAQRSAYYTLDVDDIVVDRLATVLIKDENGNTVAQKGAPAVAAGGTGFGGNEAEKVNLPNNAEVYNGSTAKNGILKYYCDKNSTEEISSKSFGAVNETIYSKLDVLQSDVNQVAFCGFDEYKLRSSYPEKNYGSFGERGYNNSATEVVWSIVDTEAYSGTKSMHMALSKDYNASRRFLYIGNDYEFEDNVSYQVSLRIKKDTSVEQNGYLEIFLGNGGDVYGHFMYGQAASKIRIPAEEISSEWTEITLSLTYIPQINSEWSYPVDFYRAPALRFDTDSNVAIFIDAITISTVCGNAAANLVDSNETDNKTDVQITASYLDNGNDKIVLAGTEYDVIERGIVAKTSTTSAELEPGQDGVLSVKKTDNFGDYWADGDNGEKIFSMLIEGVSKYDYRKIVARAYVKLSNGITYYSPETAITVAEDTAPAGYSLVWGDEFDTAAIDTSKWENVGAGDGVNYTDSIVNYNNSNDVISVKNGMLQMSVQHTNEGNYKYNAPSGLTTSATMNFKYGYLEVRARIPYQLGLSSSFWFKTNGKLASDEEKSKTLAEIDMIETFASTDTVTPNIHKWYPGGLHSQYNSGTGNTIQSYKFTSESLYDEFHIYGFEWTESTITMYIDRVEYAVYDITEDYEKGDIVGDMEAFRNPAHIILGITPYLSELNHYDYSPDKNGACYATENTDFSTSYSIDWVHLYQKDESGTLLTK